MFVYNISIKVDKQVLLPWLKWIREEYIPEIMATNLFNEHKFFELLEPVEPGTSIFVLQYFTDSREKYTKYCDEYSPLLSRKTAQKWGSNIIAFKTLMESVQ